MLSATFVMTLAGALLTQGPRDWVGEGRDAARPDAIVVSGRVELEPGAADAAALRRAAEELRWDLGRDAELVLADRAPAWLPGFLARRETRRWLADLDAGDALEVLDRRRQEHDHGSYRSFQTHVLVRHDRGRIDSALRRLAGRIDGAARRFVYQVFGSAGLCGLMALAWLWFDRLTRGYMTWRLGFLFGGMAVLGTGISLVLI